MLHVVLVSVQHQAFHKNIKREPNNLNVLILFMQIKHLDRF